MRKIHIMDVITPQVIRLVHIGRLLNIAVYFVLLVMIIAIFLVLRHYNNYRECSPTPNVYLLIDVCSDHYYNEAEYFAGMFISSYLGFDSLSIYWGSLSLISILSWRSYIRLSVSFCW